MANRYDKIVSWQDVYNEINRVINLSPMGSATQFTDTTELDIQDVARTNIIDDTDVNNLIERYNAIKNDSLYGDTTQLNSTSHTSSSVNLYSANISEVQENNIIEAITDTEARSVVYNMSRITCRNIVVCSKVISAPCNQTVTYGCYTREYYPSFSYDCYDDCYSNRLDSCSGRCGSNGCYDGGYACSQCYHCSQTACSPKGTTCSQVICHNNCRPNYEQGYECYQSCYRGCEPYRGYTPCYSNGYNCNNYSGSCSSNFYCSGKSYYCSPDTNNSCGSRCSRDSCRGRCSSECSSKGCYDVTTCRDCFSQITSVTCPDGTHNDILCSNTYWAGN